MSGPFGDDPSEPRRHYRGAEQDRLHDAPKRFYESASVTADDDGFRVVLDGRSIRTPGRNVLRVPRATIAEAIAGEWNGQGERIDPLTMPATRLANTALDGVAEAMDAVRAEIVAYAGSDLVCYRASEPEGLVTAEAEAWDPLLRWAADALGANMVLGEGIVPVAQPPMALAAVERVVAAFDEPLRLAGLHVMTTLTGSAIAALATAAGHVDVDEAWRLAHVEEDWNIALWGADEEAEARRAAREIDMRTAAAFAMS